MTFDLLHVSTFARKLRASGRFLQRVKWIVGAIAVSLCAQGVAHAQDDRAVITRKVLDADLIQFSSVVEGRFDNELQVFFDRDLATPAAERAPRRHLVIRRLDSADAATSRFYLEATDPAGALIDQRMLTIAPDVAANALKMTATPVRAGKITVDAWRTPSALAAVSVADLDPRGACVMHWTREDDHFRGRSGGACGPLLGAGERTLVATADAFLVDAAAAPDLRLRRVRPFSCWVAVLRGARHGDDGAGRDDWLFRRDVLLHDQGGEARIMTDETPAREIRLRLRRVAWPFGTNRPSLTLYVHEGAKERATSYVWGEFDATRLGINLRWLQASCTHAPEQLFESAAPGAR